MFKNMKLQSKLISSFVIMGLIVLVVAILGWNGTMRLNQHLNLITDNVMPSIVTMWEINEGKTQIDSEERSLLNPERVRPRQEVITKIENTWSQIDVAFQQLESLDINNDEEKILRQELREQWKSWAQAHQQFMQLEAEYNNLNISNPWKLKAELLEQEQKTSPQMAAIEQAIELRRQMYEQRKVNRPLSEEMTDLIQQNIANNENFGTQAKQMAEQDVKVTTFWVFTSMIIGPVTAIILGIFLSKIIAQPLDNTLQGIVNVIVSSASQIGSTVEEHERIASQQASSVSETTTTMDQLNASSRQSAEQAEAGEINAQKVLKMVEEGTAGARQVLELGEEGSNAAHKVLQLAQDGTEVVKKTVHGISYLEEKVLSLANQIMRLSQQINQIGSITNMVSDMASQTNMLALNASVEAVRAGDSGKGFGVVAAEIRKLADQSRTSADKINDLVIDIQNLINATVMVTDEGKANAKESIDLSEKTAEAFNGVVGAINQVILRNQGMIVDAINSIVLKNQEMTLEQIQEAVMTNKQIALTSQQQAVAIEQVVVAMNKINSGSQETVAGITQTKQGIQNLKEAANSLKALSGR